MCIDAIVEETNLDRLQTELSFLRMKASLETNFNGLVPRKDERVAMKGKALPPCERSYRHVTVQLADRSLQLLRLPKSIEKLYQN